MSQLLAGKRGIVLGVANNRSIAWACAKLLNDQGAQLALNFLGEAQEKRVRPLVAELNPGALVFPCDVSKDEDISQYIQNVSKHWDKIDFIIHSVAYADKEDLKDAFYTVSRKNFLMAMDISAYSLVGFAREARHLFQGSGSIVSMTYYGAEKVVPHYNVMGVAKACLEVSSKYLAEDLGREGVRVNCISAGPVRTLAASAIPGFRSMLETSEKYAPLRKNISAEDAARAALFLVSDLSTSITGEVLHVDAGYNILGMFMDKAQTPGG